MLYGRRGRSGSWDAGMLGCWDVGLLKKTADCDGKEVQLQSSGPQTKFYGSSDAKNEFKLYENCIINGCSPALPASSWPAAMKA